MNLPTIPGTETIWRLKGFSGDGQEKVFTEQDAVASESGEKSCSWKFDNGLEVRLSKDERGFRFSYEHCPAGLEIREMQFPVWRLKAPELRLLLPESMGFLTGAVSGWTDDATFYRSFYPFQMTACFGKEQNILAIFPDEDHYCKNIKVRKNEGIFESAVIFYVPQQEEFVRSYAVPYPVILENFTGGWFEAAERYRKWAWTRPVYRKLTTRGNPLRTTAMWFWNRGKADEVGDPVIRFAERSGLPVALDWYWWHHNPYDTDYPFYWPPREGTEKYTEKIAELKAHGVFTQVYTNGMTWDMDNPSWENGGQQSAIVMEDGNVMNIAFNRYNHHRLAYLCGESRPFQKHITEQAEKIRHAGTDGLYLDQVGCVSNYIPCRNPLHRHRRGGGNYHHLGYAEYIAKVRQLCPGMLLSTEDCSEEYLEQFESMIVLCNSIERMTDRWDTMFRGEFVPVFQAVYHGIAALFGTYAVPDGIPPWDDGWPADDRWPQNEEQEWEKLFPDQFYLEIARNVICGMQPTVHCLRNRHWTDPRFRECMDFLLDTARFYSDHLEWLFDGVMLEPGRLDAARIEVKFMTRSIYTKKANMKIQKKILPAVLHSVWRSPGGKKALILGNYTREEQHFGFGRIQGVLPSRSWKCILPDEM